MLHLLCSLDPNLPEESHPSEQHAHHGHSHSLPEQEQAGIGSLVWMVAMGDGIHNLTDGLAIGEEGWIVWVVVVVGAGAGDGGGGVWRV